jgi:hypothetical protein
VCNRCKARTAECVWDLSSSQADADASLERIKFLEDKVKQLQRSTCQPNNVPNEQLHTGFTPTAMSGTTPGDVPIGYVSHLSPGISLRFGSAIPPSAAEHRNDLTSPSDHSIPTVIGASTEGQGNEGFFGTSSAGTFMRSVKRLVESRLQHERPEQPSKSTERRSSNSVPLGSHTKQTETLDYELPPRRTADSLMAAYWDHVDVIYPFLDPTEVKEGYEAIWTGSEIANDKAFICLINSMFAITCQLTKPLETAERKDSAAIYYSRAKQLFDVFDPPSLRLIQSYLLLGMYLQSTDDHHSCWLIAGLAIRTAQSLGLHLPETTELEANVVRRETMRRTWYGCVIMDRTISMVYGRPPIIGPQSAKTVALPLPRSEKQPRGLVDDFYLSTIKLYESLHDVLYTFYRSDTPMVSESQTHEQTFGLFASISGIDGKLSRWEAGLPAHLRLGCTAQDQDGRSRHQAIVLRQR